jgi:hypothetical protein
MSAVKSIGFFVGVPLRAIGHQISSHLFRQFTDLASLILRLSPFGPLLPPPRYRDRLIQINLG